MYTEWIQVLMEARKGIEFLGAGVIGNCEMLCMCSGS